MSPPREALKVDVNMYWRRLPVLRLEDMSSAECNASRHTEIPDAREG
jgi:hypothetical protein